MSESSDDAKQERARALLKQAFQKAGEGVSLILRLSQKNYLVRRYMAVLEVTQ
jgi:hypothetical protein